MKNTAYKLLKDGHSPSISKLYQKLPFEFREHMSYLTFWKKLNKTDNKTLEAKIIAEAVAEVIDSVNKEELVSLLTNK